jgi:cbb3-type cytochrome oxidase maturation protein
MAALYIALPVALLLAAVGVAAFIWSVRSGQLDDLDTPAVRPLVDDDEPGADRPRSAAECASVARESSSRGP